jgi:hypothetical protein
MTRPATLLAPALLVLLLLQAAPVGAEGEPAAPPGAKAWPDAIMDNSFLIEEAYNQEPGVVQFIFNFQLVRPQNDWLMTFTNEWPVPGMRHQLSYTLAYTAGSEGASGAGDLMLNYRYQVLDEERDGVAFAPRFSALIPSGDWHRGLGMGTTGYQLGLPFSKRVSASFAMHLNLGASVWPGARTELADGSTSREDLWALNEGGSVIWLVSPTFNVMLEALAIQAQGVDEHGGFTWTRQGVVAPGFRYAFNLAAGQLVVGASAPIGINRDSQDPSLFLYLSWEMPVWHPPE